tara:strand:+ start:3351 stop:3992 length:642 start_codon:yes stop_codon:yes gene_type:complete
MKDYYKVLEVSSDAAPDAIKKSFRRLSRECHPDLNPDDPSSEERFKKLNEAYSVLSDQHKKQEYDYQRGNLSRSAFPPGSHASFEAMFDELFSRGRPRPNPEKNRIINFQIPADKLVGKTAIKSYFTLNEEIVCPACSGVGGDGSEECAPCSATGRQDISHQVGGMYVRQTLACVDCAGRGRKFEMPCGICNTQGTIIEKKKYCVDMSCKEIK